MLIVQRAREKNIPMKVAFYIWLLIMGTAAYSFSVVHAYSYSLIGYQGAFLKYYYPLYWHTACLTINAQAADIETDDDELEELDETQSKKNKTSDYVKLALAIFELEQQGIKVHCPDINKSEIGFSVDAKNNTILYGLKALDKVGDEIAQQIINLRPYSSFKDFLNKNVTFDAKDFPERKKLNKNTILSLIFSNSFESLSSGKVKKSQLIVQYLSLLISPVEDLNARYLEQLKNLKILPVEYYKFIDMKFYMPKIKKNQCEENKKVWKISKNEDMQQNDLIQHIYDVYCSCIEKEDMDFIYLTKRSTNAIFKEVESNIKNWLEQNSEELKSKLNNIKIKKEFQEWTKGKTGSDLAFSSMGMYPNGSWLDTAAEDYGISEYLKLPIADNNIINWGKYKGMEYPIFKISQIPVTVIDKNTKHKTVIGYTKNAIITLKFKNEVFDYYSSNFVRGEKLIVWGYRGNKENTFTVKLYGSVKKENINTHTVIKI